MISIEQEFKWYKMVNDHVGVFKGFVSGVSKMEVNKKARKHGRPTGRPFKIKVNKQQYK